MDKERAAVDAEHQKNLLSDSWRQWQALRFVADKAHPMHHFGTGTRETLQRPWTAVDLREFHRAHYTAERMALSVLTTEPLDSAERLVVELFSDVPTSKPSLNTTASPLPLQPSAGGNFDAASAGNATEAAAIRYPTLLALVSGRANMAGALGTDATDYDYFSINSNNSSEIGHRNADHSSSINGATSGVAMPATLPGHVNSRSDSRFIDAETDKEPTALALPLLSPSALAALVTRGEYEPDTAHAAAHFTANSATYPTNAAHTFNTAASATAAEADTENNEKLPPREVRPRPRGFSHPFSGVLHNGTGFPLMSIASVGGERSVTLFWYASAFNIKNICWFNVHTSNA